jgi:two-component system cell cycle response regulator DivK
MSKSILVVEDHEDSRRILHDLLTNAGYKVIEAVTGEEGMVSAETYLPDLILMDIRLPDTDGYEVTRRIKATSNLEQIPIIAVTSYALRGDYVKAAEAGCNAYIAKPFSPRELLAKVNELLGA